jgi:putative membrane protein
MKIRSASHGPRIIIPQILIAQKNIILPTSVSDENQKKIDGLSRKTGRAFDRDYMDAMVKDHHSTIDMFESAMKNTKAPDVNSFADKTLPTLNMHLELCKKCEIVLKTLKGYGKNIFHKSISH